MALLGFIALADSNQYRMGGTAGRCNTGGLLIEEVAYAVRTVLRKETWKARRSVSPKAPGTINDALQNCDIAFCPFCSPVEMQSPRLSMRHVFYPSKLPPLNQRSAQVGLLLARAVHRGKWPDQRARWTWLG